MSDGAGTAATTDGLPAGPAPALSLTGFSKSFGGPLVLADVHMDVVPGEIHGLVGRNGSGKSTLIKILAGFHAPEPGARLALHGREVALPLAPGAARKLGLAFIHQDLGLVPSLSVLENMRVGSPDTGVGWRLRWRSERAAVRAALRRFALDVPPDVPVGSLREVDRALVAIVRGLNEVEEHSGGVLVLDEPTAYLPRDGVERLFAAVREVAAAGTGVVFVSHRLEEVATLTDRVSVLRDGRLIDTVATAATPEDRLIEMILGRRLEDLYPQPHESSREVGFAARGVSGKLVRDVSMEVRRGEILGLTGLIAMGQEELLYLLAGADAGGAGEVTMDGRTLPVGRVSPRVAKASGVALLPADRAGASGVLAFSVAENVTLPTLSERFFRGGLLRHRREAESVAGLLRRFAVDPPDPRRRLGQLSGGNQQKALIGKWMQERPPVLLLHEPTQGVDVGAKKEIFGQVRQAAVEGACVVISSAEYEDLAHLCDRVLVFRDGRVVGELSGADLTEERIVEQCYRAAPANGAGGG